MASCLSTMQDVHILLVEHDTNHLISTKQLLEFFSYKVKCVEHASAALSILSNGKAQFDILMANIYSPDACTFKLVQEAVKKDLLVILMCDYDDDMMARSALEQGAFLFLPKPIKMENVKYLWQHVWREKTWKIKEKEQLGEMRILNRLNKEFGVEEEIPLENVMSDDNDIAEKVPKSRKNVRHKEVWTKWTQELHEKFEDAIIKLGEGRCYPKEILEIMNVPGLTRLQVASHLQKCRKGSWKPSKERKRQNSNAVASQEIEATKLKKKKFGSMPVLTEHFEQQNLPLEENAEKIQEHQTSGLINNNVIDYHSQVQSKHDLSGYAISEDNVEARYMEPDGTLLITVPDAFMPIEQFIFDFNSVTSGNLQSIDIDQPNEQGSSERSPENEEEACLRWS